MAMRLVQFRYYGINHPNQENNFPRVVEREGKERLVLWPEAYTFEKYGNINYIKIQTVPGTRIYLNRSLWNGGSPFVVGSTGILEISVRKRVTEAEKQDPGFDNSLMVSGFALDAQSKETINTLEDGYLIITIAYEVEDQSTKNVKKEES